MRLQRGARIGLGFLLIAALLAAVPAAAQERGITPTEIILGTSAPLSGPAAPWGATARGVEAYLQYINEQGGIHGRTFRFVIRDDGYQPPRAVANVRELVERVGVFGIVGMIGSANAAAVRDYMFRNEVVWMTPAVESDPWIGNPNIHYLFVTYPNYFQEAKILTRYAVEELGKRRIAVIYQNDQYGQGGLRGVLEALSELGLEPAATVSYELTDADLSVHALRIAEAQADAVILYATPNHGAMAAAALYQLNPRPQILSSFTLADPIMARLAGEAWNGVIVPSYFPYPGTDPKVDRVLQILLERNPDLAQMAFNALAGVTFIEPMLEGFRRAGPNVTKESWVAAMESIQNWDGELLRGVTFGPNRRQGINAIYLSRMENGVPQRLTDWIEYPVQY
ncbi:MAG TPA: ABC transporter substrate-binding protein [Limnochordales bacterium]